MRHRFDDQEVCEPSDLRLAVSKDTDCVIHGLTGFIATWWGPGTYDDRAFATLLARAGQKGFKVTVYWETAPGEGAAQIDRAVADLLYVLQRCGSADAFLKVDGKPVVFVYGRVMDQVPLASWPAIIQRVRQQYDHDFALIADGYNEAYARLFDGVHTYNICGWVQGKTAEELRQASAAAFADAVRLAKSRQPPRLPPQSGSTGGRPRCKHVELCLTGRSPRSRRRPARGVTRLLRSGAWQRRQTTRTG